MDQKDSIGLKNASIESTKKAQWLALSKALGIKEPVRCGPEVGF
jgi:hypothetical protein